MMINFVIHKGRKIIQSGSCHPTHLQAQLALFPDCEVTEVPEIQEDCYIENGSLILFPACPNAHCVFDYENLCWNDPRTNEQLIADLLEQVKKRRDVAISSGTSVNGMPFATDNVTQARITGAALSAIIDPTYSVQWKMPDGVFVLLTGQDVILIAQAIRAHVQACFDREAEIKALIEAGQPYDLEAGWPAV